MEKKSKRNALVSILVGASLALTGAHQIDKMRSGVTLKDYIGGKNKVTIYEDGIEKKLEVPVYPIWKTPPSHCALYAKLTTEALGNSINRGNAWEVEKRNPSYEYSPETLSQGDLVGFYNPKSTYNFGKDNEKREYSHVATYLGRDANRKEIYAEQRGRKSRITSIDQFTKEGWTPKKIIKVRKNTI